MTEIKHKNDYPVIGTLELTAPSLAFINTLFNIVTELTQNPELMEGNMDIIMQMSMMVALGQDCEPMIRDLNNLHVKNAKVCKEAHMEHADKAANVALNMFITSMLAKQSPEFKERYDGEMSNISEMAKSMKKEGWYNAPETGYQ